MQNTDEGRFRAVVEGAPNAMVMVDARGIITLINSQTERLFSYRREELLGQPMKKLVPKRLHNQYPELCKGYSEDTKPRSAGLGRDMYCLRRDGSEVPVEIDMNPITIEKDNFVLASIIDLTERRRGEERFRVMVEGAPSAMVMVSETGIITLVNSQTEKLFGYRREELQGRSIEILVPARFRVAHSALRAGFYQDPKERNVGTGRDLCGLRRDGTEVPVEIGLNPIVTEEGRFVLASINDITKRKVSEARAEAYIEELRLLSQRLLEIQETERRVIARDLHDEIGQALTATQINLQELALDAGTEQQATRLKETSAIIERLLQQVRQMSLDLHPSVLDDLGIASAIRWVIRERTAKSGIAIKLDLQEDLPRYALAVETTAFRVFQEAMTNVLRHSLARNLTVSLAKRGRQLELDIQDDGCGFDATAAQRQVLAGKSLGLIGMRERARLAGGHIVIESTPGEGAWVRLSLPATER